MSLVDVALLVVFSPLMLLLSLHSAYLLVSGRVRDAPAREPNESRTVSIVVPVKSEPIDLVCECVEHLCKSVESLGGRASIYVVSDDDEEYVGVLRSRLSALDPPVPVEVVRRSGRGGRVGALNFALRSLVKSDVLVVLDVDARPGEGFFEELLRCAWGRAACVGHWVGYWARDTRIARALAFSTELVAAALYRGRQALNLLVFPLGSGTAFDAESLRAVGGWEEGTIQDDVIIGMKLWGSGYRVGYSSKALLRVLVPSSYRAFRIQQLKWAYGSVESLRYSFRYLDKRLGFLRSAEARLYVLQYFTGLSILVASVVVPVLALATGRDLGHYTVLAASALPSLYVVAVIRTLRASGTGALGVLRRLGTASAIGLAVAPVVVKGLVLGVLGRRPKAPVTPKGPEDRERYREYLEEYAVATLSAVLGIAALSRGLYVASGFGFLPAIALAYTLLRATRDLTAPASALVGRRE